MDNPEIIDEARSINSSLRRVKQLVQLNTFQAESASAILGQDGDVIKDSLDEHKYGLKEALRSTKQRLSLLKFAEFREKYMIAAAVSFYVLVALYIILKRTGLLSFIEWKQCR